MQEIQFDYFWGGEADQFSFYRIPKVLFTAEYFNELSCEAKVLYGLMLDRMGLSIKNHWFDEDGRVYIVFTIEDVIELLNCSRQKAIKIVGELDKEKGIGLIEKKRLGLGRPNVIYVKNFMLREVEQEKKAEIAGFSQKYENHTSGSSKSILQEVPKSYSKKYENHTSGSSKIIPQEVPESYFKKYENHTSGSSKIIPQEVPKSYSNNTDMNDTEKNDTISSYPSFKERTKMDMMELMDTYRNIVRENISYEALVHDGLCNMEELEELVELIVEVLILPDEFMLRIGGTEKTAAVVKSRFLKLTMTHIEYVMNCIHNTTTKVGNIKAYLLTTLYNATMTIEHYYQAEVGHDMSKIIQESS